jgi:autotransporter-associated beta strand protein
MNSSDPFVDSINENRVITANGTATISTEIKYAGAASLSLGPAELEPISYLSTPHNSDFDLSGDFTIDFYIYPTAIPSAGFSYIFITSQSTDGFFITWDQYDNNTINIGQVGTADILVSTDPAPINEWTRVTITRELDLIKIFINSVLSSSAENSTNFTSDSSNEARFGEGENVGAGAGFIGYIDEFKLINGTAVNPTPPPSPTPSITPTITKTKTPTPTVTKTPTPSFTPMTIDICQSGPTINLGSGRSTGYYNYVGSGCITNRVINLSGSTGGGTLISSGSGPLIFTSNITSAGIGNKAFTLGGNNTGRNRVNRLRDPSPGGGSNGRVRLVKDGSGSWEITGASGNYSGGTTISEGTLIVSGANVSGVANGPLGIGSITIGNSGTNSTDSAFLLLEENVNFNRNINLRNIPQKNVIIGGANVSGTCTFGSGVSFIPSQVASYGELYIVSSTGGEVKIQSDLNTLDSKYTNTQIIFGLKNQTYDGKIVIETAIAGKANKLMNLLFNSGNTALTKANTFTGSSVIKNGIAIAEVNSPIDGNGAFGYSLNGGLGGGSSPPIVLGDETDFSDGLAGLLLDKGAQFGRIVMIPELGIESTQKVVIGGANTSGITRFQSTATFFVNRDIILQCANSGIVNISCGFLKGEPGDFDSLTSSFIIGSSGNSGTVLLSGNLNTSGSVSVEYGTLEVTGTLYGAQGIIITGKNAVLKYNSDLIELSSDISININNSGSLTGFGNIFGEIIINNSGILNPGDDILRNIIPTYHKLILNSGGKLKTKIFDNSTFNQAIVSDSGIFINSTENNPFIIEIDPFDGISTNSFTILANSATLDGFDANKFNIVNNNPLVSGTFGLEASSSNIVLTYTDP